MHTYLTEFSMHLQNWSQNETHFDPILKKDISRRILKQRLRTSRFYQLIETLQWRPGHVHVIMLSCPGHIIVINVQVSLYKVPGHALVKLE